MIDDLNANQLQKLADRVRQLEVQAPIGHSSVTQGSLRIASDEGLVVEGSERITGEWYLDGTGYVDGSVTIDGPLYVNGPFAVTSGLALMSSTILFIDTLNAASTADIYGTFHAHGDGLVSGQLTNAGYATTTTPANTYLTGGGLVSRVTSAARFKIDPQELEIPDEILNVPMKSWIDLAAAEKFAELYDAPRPLTQEQQRAFDDISLRRVPGVVAEDVEAAGGSAFVDYAPDGTVMGVYYDRYWGAQIAVLNRLRQEDSRRIAALEETVAKLLKRLEPTED